MFKFLTIIFSYLRTTTSGHACAHNPKFSWEYWDGAVYNDPTMKVTCNSTSTTTSTTTTSTTSTTTTSPALVNRGNIVNKKKKNMLFNYLTKG